MKSRPLVSVIMTVYNHERFVAESINSILQQTFHDFEIVIVDDGSDDRSLEVVRQSQSDDARVIVVPQPRIGRGRALNVALEHSHGTYIAIMDADDLAEPDRLEKQLAYLKQHPLVGELGVQKRLFYEDDRSDRVGRVPLTDFELRRALPRRNTMIHISVMMPRAVLADVGGYDESLSLSLDYDLWIRIAARYELANLPDVLVVERDHGLAFFRNRIPNWVRFKTRTKLRWRAWREFSRNPADLWFVIDPIDLAKWIVRDNCPTLRRFYHTLTRRPCTTLATEVPKKTGH